MFVSSWKSSNGSACFWYFLFLYFQRLRIQNAMDIMGWIEPQVCRQQKRTINNGNRNISHNRWVNICYITEVWNTHGHPLDFPSTLLQLNAAPTGHWTECPPWVMMIRWCDWYEPDMENDVTQCRRNLLMNQMDVQILSNKTLKLDTRTLVFDFTH